MGLSEAVVIALCAAQTVLIVGLLIANLRLRKQVTASERTEIALRESEARYRAVVEDQTELICRFLPDGTFTFVNDAYCRYFQCSAQDLIGKTFYEFIPREGHQAARDFLDSITPQQAVATREHEVVAPGGETRWQQWSDRGFFDEQGKIVEYQAVGRDITELKRAEEGLAQLEAQKQLEAVLRDADRRKDEFLAMLAHELRNPLAPVSMAVETMRRIDVQNPELQNARDVLARQVSHLTRLVDDLLDVSRITRGKINMELKPLDLSGVVMLAVETSRPSMLAGKHELSLDLPRTPLEVRGDAVRLAQVVSNLLNNAAKYSGSGTSIRLVVRRDGSEAVVSVRDDGIGISEAMLDRIFEPFMQIAATQSRSQGGLGIGLTLVKRLVEMHDGRVEARSAGHGRGSEFVVRLPLLDPDRSDEAISRPSVLESNVRAAPRRILVVDDNVDAADLLGRLLAREAHQVEVVHDGASALSAAERGHPDVVLLDLGLPTMDGLEVARRLRQKSSSSSLLLIAVSGYAQPEDRRRTTEAGFDHHLAKPIDLVALQALIHRAPRRIT